MIYGPRERQKTVDSLRQDLRLRKLQQAGCIKNASGGECEHDSSVYMHKNIWMPEPSINLNQASRLFLVQNQSTLFIYVSDLSE